MTVAYYVPVPAVGVEITNRCQLNCQHCFNHSGEGQLQELSLSDLVRVFDQVKEMGSPSIRLSGGEPTLHPDFAAIVIAADKRGLQISLNTNGIYSRHLRQELGQLPVEQYIVSLDGLQAANDRIRGRGVFERVLETLEWLQDLGRRLLIGVHLSHLNQADIPGLVALAAGLGCDIKFSPMRPLGRAVEYLPAEMLSAFEFYQAVQTITALRQDFPHIRVSTDYDVLQPLKPGELPLPARESCPAGRSLLNINFDGFVYPCAFLVTPQREFAAGHIHQAPLLTLWREGPVFQQFRSTIKDEVCQACPVYTRTCVGGCVAISYLVTGRLEAHDPTCFFEDISPSEWKRIEAGRDCV